jgi:hypothetical protein
MQVQQQLISVANPATICTATAVAGTSQHKSSASATWQQRSPT